MKVVVLDTSAVIRLYVPDGPLPHGLESCIEEAWRGDAVLLAPELVLAEAAQVLLKKERARKLDSGVTAEILDAILDLPLKLVGHRDLLPDALALARRHKVTVYDALFIALALRHKADLVTADADLGKALLVARKS